MKKALLAILAFIYLTTTSGISIHMHYCMGKLVGTSFLQADADHCSTCGMHKENSAKKGCCSDKHDQVKLQADQKIASIQEFQSLQNLGVAIITEHILQPEPFITNLASLQPVSNSPPRSQGQPVYLLNCNFRI